MIGLDSNILSLLLVGLICAFPLLLFKAELVLWILVFGTLVFAGTVQYFGRLNQVQWVPSLLGAVMFVRAILELGGNRPTYLARVAPRELPIPAFLWLFLAYVAIALVASLRDFDSLGQFLAGIKNYIAIWGVVLFMALSSLSPEALSRIWKGVVLIALLQFPFVVYQHFFVASKRALVSAGYHRPAWDSVVGTFGGDPDGGGASGALALFLVVALTLILAWWKNGLLKSRYVAGAGLLIFATILLAEVKVVLSLIPFAIFLLFARVLLRRPLLLVGFCASMAVVFAAIVFAYQSLYWEKGVGRKLSAGEHVERALRTNLDPENLDPRTGEVGRMAMLSLWARDTRTGTVEKLLGHGFGSSRISFVGAGEVARRYYPFQVGRSAAASMLWDIGLLGFVAFSSVLITALLAARRLVRNAEVPLFHRSVLEASIVGMVLLYAMMFYNADVLYLPAIGFLLMMFLGHIAYWQLRARSISVR